VCSLGRSIPNPYDNFNNKTKTDTKGKSLKVKESQESSKKRIFESEPRAASKIENNLLSDLANNLQTNQILLTPYLPRKC